MAGLLPPGTAPVANDYFGLVAFRAVVACKCGRRLYQNTRCGRCKALAVAPKRSREDAAAAEQLETHLWKKRLRDGNSRVRGILAERDPDGDELVPFAHQRRFVTKALQSTQPFFANFHMPGLGKTATCVQYFAALELLHNGGATALVSVPLMTLLHWKETFERWIDGAKLPPGWLLATNKAEKLPTSAAALAPLRVVVVTHHILQRLHKAHTAGPADASCGRAALVFGRAWSLFAIDEAHVCRNPATDLCQAHAHAAKSATRRLAITATPIINGPLDMVGLCVALNADHDLQQRSTWSSAGRKTNIFSKDAAERFRRVSDRVTKDALGLPPLVEHLVDFEVALAPADVAAYNALLDEAQKCNVVGAQVVGLELTQRLTQILYRLQAFLVAPLLAQEGADAFRADAALAPAAAAQDTGLLKALRRQVELLFAAGEQRLLLVACHVQILRVAQAYLAARLGGDLETFTFDSTDSSAAQKERSRQAFLRSPGRSIMFLSMKAGGQGIQLAPGCSACVFFGSTPFSPASLEQATSRIHRQGQDRPCLIRHLVAAGSIDAAIRTLHGDKDRLAHAILNCDFTEMGNEKERRVRWRTMRRIVDGCAPAEPGGNLRRAAPLADPLGVATLLAPAGPPAPDVMELQKPVVSFDTPRASGAGSASRLPPL